MKKYSQNSEQDIILNYFKDQPRGTYLDIGAYHPEVFSNTRALYELGWKGVLIEPAKQNFDHITDYFKEDKEIQVIQTCVGTYDGEIDFMDSNGDAIGTTVVAHAKIWAEGYGTKYTNVKSRVITFETLLGETIYKKFDFINIDVEGTNMEVLRQIDLNSIGCRLLCVEFNGKDFDVFNGHCVRQGFKLVHRNGENLIYGK